jgi:hypothetical protein
MAFDELFRRNFKYSRPIAKGRLGFAKRFASERQRNNYWLVESKVEGIRILVRTRPIVKGALGATFKGAITRNGSKPRLRGEITLNRNWAPPLALLLVSVFFAGGIEFNDKAVKIGTAVSIPCLILAWSHQRKAALQAIRNVLDRGR